MTVLGFWSASWTAALLNHLWQSTVVVAIAWMLAVSLRKNQARVRFWVWLAASVKFLLPFSFLIAAGEWLGSLFTASVDVKPSLVGVVQQIELPFSQPEYFRAPAPLVPAHRGEWILVSLALAWFCGALVISARFLRRWRLARTALRDASPFELAPHVPSFLTDEPMEPGVFGVFSPVLLLPRGILDQLSGAQLEAIVAHEMCHVRRRDNLTFALHMVVEVLFWFHPAVWWIGEQLVAEREHACDEEVIKAGASANTYAEGILNVCKFCVELPSSCVSSVTGADLKQRIVNIMRNRMARELSIGRKALLGTAAMASLAVPLILGMGRAPEMSPEAAQQTETDNLPKFEVVSIKPDKSATMMTSIRMTPDGVNITGMPLNMMVREAFDLPGDRVLNGPDWLKSDRYDVAAKVNSADVSKLGKLEPEQRWAMMLPVLEDRCGLKFHHETRTLEVYALILAKGGPKLKLSESETAGPMKTAAQSAQAPLPPPTSRAGDGVSDRKLGQFFMRMSTQGMTMNANGVPIAGLVRLLSLQLGSTVVDKTGLTGKYDFTLSWTPDQAPAGMPEGPGGGPAADGGAASAEPNGPSLFTAVQEQLGLKLVARKEAVDVVVIDSIEKPSAN